MLGISDGLRGELAAIGAPVGVSVVMPGMIKTGMNPSAASRPSRWPPTCSTRSGAAAPYVFTDDHSIQEVDTRLSAIIAARADVVS